MEAVPLTKLKSVKEFLLAGVIVFFSADLSAGLVEGIRDKFKS